MQTMTSRPAVGGAARLTTSRAFSNFASPAKIVARSRVSQKTAFLQTLDPCASLCASFSGLSVSNPMFGNNGGNASGRGALVIMANAKRSLGCTFGGSNKKRRNVSGYRARAATPGGRRVLKRRRDRGRWVLCKASLRKGKYVSKPRRRNKM